jgi:hypothetical protein
MKRRVPADFVALDKCHGFPDLSNGALPQRKKQAELCLKPLFTPDYDGATTESMLHVIATAAGKSVTGVRILVQV